MKNCTRCTASIEPIPGHCVLYLVPPTEHAAGRIRACLGRIGEPVDRTIEGVLATRLGPGQLVAAGEELASTLPSSDLEDTRSLVIEDGVEPSMADLMRAEPLSRRVAALRAHYINDLVGQDRLTYHFQPIVYSRSPESVYAYECLLRGIATDGQLIPPLTLYHDAREAGLLFQLDRAARLKAVREAVTHGLNSRLFINFNPSSIYDPVTCLRSTVAATSEAGLPPGNVTFEIVESERADPKLLGAIVRYYRAAGFRVALDDLGAGYSSLNLLNALRPDFVKLDRELVSGVDLDPYKACIASALVQMAGDLGIEAIAEGVETEGELAWLQNRGVDYIQGYLIARPGLPPFTIERPAPMDAVAAESSF